MNLRKDHYRSFTRTLCTVHVFLGLAVALARSSALGAPRICGSTGATSARRVRLPTESALLFMGDCLDVIQPNHTTLVDGYLGMSNDEERSEMRYVVRIAEFSESSRL